MVHHRIKYLIISFIFTAGSCTHEPATISAGGGYPAAIANIITKKCATAGCHNNNSYIAAGGLNLATWEDMFKGSRSGAVVIPYRPDYSTMCFYTNTDTSLGLALSPTMPAGGAPLSKEEYLTLANWIASGAADNNGTIKFTDNPERKKLYITNRMCDVVTVIDAETLLPMRYVNTGNGSQKFPYCVKAAPDRKHWYVSFFATTNIIQKFSADNDKPVGELNIGPGSWTSFAITKDSKYGYFVDNSSPGKIAYADLEHMQLLATYTYSSNFKYPSGIAINEVLNKIYVGNTFGNFIYIIDIADPLNPVISSKATDGGNTAHYESSVDPTELLVNENNNTCYLACAGSHEIKVMDMEQDVVISNIPLGFAPAYMAYSKTVNKLFVSCPDDQASFPPNRGSVAVVDLASNTLVKRVNSGYQPYGIAINEEMGWAAVVNANISSEGPSSHHSSKCGEKNGNVTFIELSTLNLLKDIKRELVVFPFGIAVR